MSFFEELLQNNLLNLSQVKENRDVNLRSNLESFLEEVISVFRNIYQSPQDDLELIVTITEK
jgi:hypothetical protein